MPLEPGEKYTMIEVDIMRSLGHSKHRLALYENLRKTKTNPNILLAVAAFKMLNFSLTSENNLVGPLEGYCTMDDLAMLEGVLKQDKMTVRFSEGALRFSLAKIADNQYFIRRIETFVLDINPLAINQVTVEFDNYKGLTDNFNALIRKVKPADLFERKFVVIPVFHLKEAYLTFIANPFASIKPTYGDRSGTCNMYHIGTKDLTEYKETVVPRIMRMLTLFSELYGPLKGYAKFIPESIEVEEKVLPLMAVHEKPLQLIWVLDQFLGRQNEIREYKSIFEKLGSDRTTMITEMETVRKRIGTDMFIAISQSNNRAAKHLLQKREQIKAHIEAQPASESSDDDEQPAAKKRKLRK